MSNDTIGAGPEWLMLTEADRARLRQERVTSLEADLFRERLVEAEAGSVDEQRASAQRIAEYRRRIAVHMDAMLPVDVDDGRDVSGPVSLSE